MNPAGLHKYSERIYDTCILSFQALPIAALIDDKFFCVHGGLSPDLKSIKDIDKACITGICSASCD